MTITLNSEQITPASEASKGDCPFCQLIHSTEVVLENDTFVAKYDRYPVSKGHMLLIPKRHVRSFFELQKAEAWDFFQLLKLARLKVLKEASPDAFNIGINDGHAAGQTIEHLHIHLIPRYEGDVDHPAGGVRNIIPNLVLYSPADSKSANWDV